MFNNGLLFDFTSLSLLAILLNFTKSINPVNIKKFSKKGKLLILAGLVTTIVSIFINSKSLLVLSELMYLVGLAILFPNLKFSQLSKKQKILYSIFIIIYIFRIILRIYIINK